MDTTEVHLLSAAIASGARWAINSPRQTNAWIFTEAIGAVQDEYERGLAIGAPASLPCFFDRQLVCRRNTNTANTRQPKMAPARAPPQRSARPEGRLGQCR